jgi:hypothetical protein
MAWRKAAIAVLERSTKPMPAVDIGEGVGKLGLRKNIGRRSGAEIYRVITASIDKHGTKSPFVETEPGYYDLRSKRHFEESSEDRSSDRRTTSDACCHRCAAAI